MHPGWTVLARQNERCYTARCRRGVVHLVWNWLSLHLDQATFVRLTDMIVAECARQRQAPSARVRLGLSACVLEFSARDFKILSDLVQQTRAKLGRPAHSIILVCPQPERLFLDRGFGVWRSLN